MSCIRIQTLARIVVFPDNEEKIIDIIRFLSNANIPFLVLGKMSNVLFKAPVYNGVIIKTTKIDRKVAAEDGICLSCGCSIQGAVNYLADNDKGGFEGLFGIPGSIGGMVKQNAGAFGYEISDLFLHAEIYDIFGDKVVRYSKENMCFGYRSSVLKPSSLVLLNAVFSVISIPKEEVFRKISELKDKRKQSQPVGEPSLGCVFKRADGIGAGYYIDRLGLKGYRIGGAEISHKHAGFIVNKGTATADDVLRLIEFIKEKVYSEFGIVLEEEIEII